MKRKDKYNYQFNWESINDVIYYMEWKLEEIVEAGCELEYTTAEKTLKWSQNIGVRALFGSLRYSQPIDSIDSA